MSGRERVAADPGPWFWQLRQLALHVALNTPHPRAQRLEPNARAFVLLCMRIAPHLNDQATRLAVEVPAQVQSLDFSGSTMRWRVRSSKRPLWGAPSSCARGPGCLDGHGRQQLHAFLADALAPARQARRVNGQLGLQVGLAFARLSVNAYS